MGDLFPSFEDVIQKRGALEGSAFESTVLLEDLSVLVKFTFVSLTTYSPRVASIATARLGLDY